MGSLITYSAIAAKLAAMRGHFLTDDEFSVLAGMENVPAAVEYLKSSPAYRDVFSGVENEELHRSKIEELLWHSLYGDFSRLKISGSLLSPFRDRCHETVSEGRGFRKTLRSEL